MTHRACHSCCQSSCPGRLGRKTEEISEGALTTSRSLMLIIRVVWNVWNPQQKVGEFMRTYIHNYISH